jgi:hypothetical protein
VEPTGLCLGGGIDTCDTASQHDGDRHEQQQGDQRERRGHERNLSQETCAPDRCGKASQAIDAIVCRGCLSACNLASLRGIMVKAMRT